MRKETKIIIGLAVLIMLVLIVFLTPVYSWVTGSGDELEITPKPSSVVPSSTEPANNTATPTSTASTTPTGTQPATATPPVSSPANPPATITENPKVVVYTDKEIQAMMGQIITMANNSGKATLQSLEARLEQDRMLVSVKGEAMGVSVEAENLETHCAGKTISMKGVVKIWQYTPELELTLEINTMNKKPVVTITKFRVGGVTLLLSMAGLSKDKIQTIINDTITARGWKLPYELDNISIENSQLIIRYK